IRKVDVTGRISTVAGGLSGAGFSGDNGPATNALLNTPWAVAVDDAGNLFIADTGNHRIRRVSPDGIIITFAGTGSASPPLGDNGPATSASLFTPRGVAVDSKGNVYIGDSFHNLVRRGGPGRGFTPPGPPPPLPPPASP